MQMNIELQPTVDVSVIFVLQTGCVHIVVSCINSRASFWTSVRLMFMGAILI